MCHYVTTSKHGAGSKCANVSTTARQVSAIPRLPPLHACPCFPEMGTLCSLSPSGVFFCRQAEDNPFALPSDEQIFMLQEVERQQRTQLMQRMRSLPVHKKSTFSSQIQATVIRDTGLEPPMRKSESKKRYAKHVQPHVVLLASCTQCST